MKKEELENIFVIGDVHGCYYTLLSLIKLLPHGAELIFVGDLCDKGNFSKDVLNFVIDKGYKCVKGNHEHLFEKYILDALEKDIHSPWSTDKRYGGLECIRSYKGDMQSVKKHLAWIKTLPMYIQIDKYFITHGFALAYYEYRENKAYYNDFLLNRYYEGDTVSNTEVVNIFGHCMYDEVVKGENFYGIETGCSYGKKLTALQLGSEKIYQVPMDARDSDYKVETITLKEYDVYAESFESIQTLVVDETSKYAKYDIIANEVLEAIVQKYGERGKKELFNMHKRAQIFPKQIKKILGHEAVKDFNF